jgi:hypothetical protein
MPGKCVKVSARLVLVMLAVAAVSIKAAQEGQADGGKPEVKLTGVTKAVRSEYVSKARVWDSAQYEKLKSITAEQIKAGQPFEGAFAFNQAVTCRFVDPTLKNMVGGQTQKFLCGGGTAKAPCPECTITQKEVKVKYGKDPKANPEIYAEVMGTRLMWLLGFKADGDYPVRVTCLDCPADPWKVYSGFRSQAGGLDKHNPKDVEKAGKIAQQLVGSRATRTFQYAVIEIKFPGEKIKAEDADCSTTNAENTNPDCGGFSWKETPDISEAAGGASKAQVDAFRLLAAFMMHGDNKPGNQRLVCPDEDIDANGHCTQPYAMIQDIGAGFGSPVFLGLGYRKADINSWSHPSLWVNLHACRARLSSTHELKNPVVSEEGRAFLSKLMDPTVLTDEKLTAIFEASRIVEKGDKYKGHPATVADWVAAFNKKRQELSESCGTTQ